MAGVISPREEKTMKTECVAASIISMVLGISIATLVSSRIALQSIGYHDESSNSPGLLPEGAVDVAQESASAPGHDPDRSGPTEGPASLELKKNALKVIVLDVDGAVVQQQRLMAQYQPAVVPLREKSEALRFWCPIEELKRLRESLVSTVGSVKGAVIFYGSGDYHHLAWLGISLMDEPLTVIHFDNHCDFFRTPFKKTTHFGHWVAEAAKLPNVRRVIQLGIDGDFDVSRETPYPMGPIGQEMDLLYSGKVEVYPNSMCCSTLLWRFRATLPSVEFTPGLLTTRAAWKNIRDHGGIEATLERILPTIPTEAVYLTIDKDTLLESENFAAYPGRQGTLTLNELLAAISLIGKHKRVIGVDVCGDASPFAGDTWSLKRLVAWLEAGDIPAADFSSPEKIRLNENANLEILERLEEAFSTGPKN